MLVAGPARNGSLQRIRDLSRELASAADLETLFTTLHVQVARMLHADSILIGLYDEKSRTIDVVRQAEFEVELPGGTFPLGRGVTSDVIRTGQSRLVRCWSQEAPRVQVQYLSSQPGLPESALTVPILLGERVLGLIAVHKYEPYGFNEDDLLVLETVAAQTAAALTALRGSERLNAQLRKRVSELEAVLGTMADAVLIVDKDARVQSLNRAARELLCRDKVSVVLGQPLQQQIWGQWPLGSAEITEKLTPMLAALARGEVPPETEVRIERGVRRVLSFNAAPLVDPHGSVTGSVIIVRDVTSRHEVEALKDEMLSVASHDLRTPVTVIRSEAQLLRRLLRRNEAGLPQINDGLASIVQQTERLARLLSLLLDVSSIEAGRFHVERSRVDLGALAARTVAEVQAITETHHLEVHATGDTTGYWDERRLQQVLGNLLTNAIKYSPDCESIDVYIQPDENNVVVRVSDHGVGLTQQEARHVFERYFRATSTRRLEGSGLGLYICRSIVRAHGGRIWVESDGPGKGSSFCFSLPRRTSRSIANPREYSQREQSGK